MFNAAATAAADQFLIQSGPTPNLVWNWHPDPDRLRALYRGRRTTSVAATRRCSTALCPHDNTLRSYLTVTDELAPWNRPPPPTTAAPPGEDGRCQVPVAVRTYICLLARRPGRQQNSGGLCPPTTFAVERLLEAGAVILGKTNTDEFAMGSSDREFGLLHRQPVGPQERVPAAGSGGSAAAVAAGWPTALGHRHRRQRAPARVVLRPGRPAPTYGRVSRWGVIAFASVARSGRPVWPTPRPTPPPCWASSPATTRAIPRRSTPRARLRGGAHRRHSRPARRRPRANTLSGHRAGVEAAVGPSTIWPRWGGDYRRRSAPPAMDLPVYYLIAPAEASANLARYDGTRFGPRVVGTGMIDTVPKRARFSARRPATHYAGTHALIAGYYDECITARAESSLAHPGRFPARLQVRRRHRRPPAPPPPLDRRPGGRPIEHVPADIHAAAQSKRELPAVRALRLR